MNHADRFENAAVLAVGDVMLDRVVSGAVERISPESPVPVLAVRSFQTFPGGAANVARNVAALGGRCTLIGVRGNDPAGLELEQAVDATSGLASSLAVCPGRPTTQKTRFVAQGQQLLRADEETIGPFAEDIERMVVAMILPALEKHRVLVLSDYAKGLLSPSLLRATIDAAVERGLPVVVDPKSTDMTRYRGATVVTPNAREVHAATGIDPMEDDAAAETAGRRIVAHAGVTAVLVTRAHRGMTLVVDGSPAVHLRALAREVFDVVGAGDTVVATLAASLANGEALAEAAWLANVAAGIVVGKRGTATVSARELAHAVLHAQEDPVASIRRKIVSFPEALALVHAWRGDGHAIGFVDGRFDALGHTDIARLSAARQRCDRLLVALRESEDTAVRGELDAARNADRALLLAAMSSVDAVVPFDAAGWAQLAAHGSIETETAAAVSR